MSTNNTPAFISQNQSGFPAYLDFNSMRSEAIGYLGPITSAYWTDYNEHDPGITTLEALLYALLDLGYRVNWPIQDLLTQKTGIAETDFLTPAQVLGSNPWTINDYRKLLMDLTEVRNAWLQVPTDPSTINGLYTVLLELEDDAADFATGEEWGKYRESVVAEVQKTLQAHRNLCEDFQEPVIMGKQPYIVKADIELLAGASIPDVYQALIKNLYSFFSPTPTFYTLGQLIAMGVSPDEVFAGRPFHKRPSHGFLLDDDLPALPGDGTPAIYPSAVLNVLLKVQGVGAVKNLNIQQVAAASSHAAATTAAALTTGIGTEVWMLPLEQQILPVFSVAGSDFRWFLNGQQLSWSPGTAPAQLQKALAYSGKVLYPFGSPELDNGVPSGQYLDGLGNYYSIQKDFPEVYGIGPGGLPPSASLKRQAQAWQFKGYLLFFEQLMADFLAQLGNIRSLLSMSGQGGTVVPAQDEDDDPEDRTGWGAEIDPAGPDNSGAGGLYVPTPGDLSDVPGLEMLLQFPPGNETNTENVVLAFPVDARHWHELVRKGRVSCEDVERLKPYLFLSAHERDLAVAELLLSFAVMPPTPGVVVLEGDKRQVFVIAGIRPDFILLSKSIFDLKTDVLAAAQTAIFAGTSNDFYFPQVLTEDGTVGYSFSLGQSDMSYKNYVSQLLSNPEQSVQQRTGYLLHLIERFAESYTDYAKLSASFLSSETISDNQVGLMQRFLTNLPLLAADRGKGYNYTRESWDNTNVSGLELRFKAYCGIGDWRRHYLCPFEVAAARQQYLLRPMMGDRALMTVTGNFTEPEGYDAASELYMRLRSETNYRLVRDEKQYRFALDLSSGEVAVSVMSWPDQAEAAAAVKQLGRMLQLTARDEDVYAHEVEYMAEVVNTEGLVIRAGREIYADETAAFEDAGKKVHDIRKERFWHIPSGTERVPAGNLERSGGEGSHLYVDMEGFGKLTEHIDSGKPDHVRLHVTNKDGGFSFKGTREYPSDTEGRAAARLFLLLLADAKNYVAAFDAAAAGFRLAVLVEGEIEATETSLYLSKEEASRRIDHITGSMLRRLYTLRMVHTVKSWKFRFYLGQPGTPEYLFESSRSYPSAEAALAAARDFYQGDTGWELGKYRNSILLEKAGGAGGSGTCVLSTALSGVEQENELQQLVVARSMVLALEQGNREALSGWLQADERFREGGYVYRLVDKDRPRAFHAMAPGDAGDEGLQAVKTAMAALADRGRKGYEYPEFCLGGDNVISKIDESGAVVYHYCIRCRNDYFFRLGLTAHDKEWILFESIASYPTEDAAQQAFQDNYFMILEKAMEQVNFGEKDFIAWDEHGRRHAVVYVNEELRRALEEGGRNVAGELVKAARNYPVRRILNRKGQPRYIFQLRHGDLADWVSAGRFASAQEAHTAFNYFRLLLVKPQNYFIDYDEAVCGYRVGIREVLAESNGTFAQEEDAWGQDGVQRFIGAAQSSGGWHPEKKGGCYWGYFVACANERASHPCTYESEGQRDRALERLYDAAQGFPVSGWLARGATGIELIDPVDGRVAAVIAGDEGATEVGLNLVLDKLDAAWAGQGNREERERLLTYGAYFPIVRKKAIGSAAEYRLEIKFPGFAALPGKELLDKSCGCPPDEPGSSSVCFAAWIREQPFSSAMDAWNAYQALLPYLADKNNYRPVHDEDALSYGIELLEEDQVLARSIQPYFYGQMAKRALDRATHCVNMEGLNLVEHVLLRKDKGVDTVIPVCAADDNASIGGYQPGVDAYSFVMTVFLPAWPQRFRNKENRQLLESMVQRETPAHILPRILWLTPGDMCRMEAGYRQWQQWLQADKHCGDFQPEELIRLLFSTPIDCMCETACGQETRKEKGDDWLSEINKLYCWADSECANTTGWETGTGNPGNKDNKPFVMSGTQLQRPALEKTTPENKPERIRLPATQYRKGHAIKDHPPGNGGRETWVRQFALWTRKVMKDSGQLLRRARSGLIKDGGLLLKRARGGVTKDGKRLLSWIRFRRRS